MDAKTAVTKAKACGIVIPAFNIPHLPMVEPVARALQDMDSFAMIQVARVEWEKFASGSLEAVAAEYAKYADPAHTLLHLDHVPVIDEDYIRVDYMAIVERAIAAGYQSVMVDGSRLPLAENIACTAEVASRAHEAGIPCEAELGAVMGHESGPIAPYEEIFANKRGFTDLEQARLFAAQSGCDWLSVAVGNIHGAVADSLRDQKKPEARLDIEHIQALADATGLPLVLHGGSGVNVSYIRRGIKAGIAKINIGTEIRQAYEKGFKAGGEAAGREAVYEKTCALLTDMLDLRGSRALLFG